MKTLFTNNSRKMAGVPLRRKKDKPYRSDTMAKSIKQKQMNQKAGRR